MRYALLGQYLVICLSAFGQDISQNSGLLARRYRDGEQLTYRMTVIDDGLRYEIQATGIVKRNTQGQYHEEYGWSNLIRNGVPAVLPPESLEFRQVLSLEPEQIPFIPNLAQVPRLIGPITDLLTFYADLWLAIREAKLSNVGDHFFQEGNMASSWADGTNVILGESAIDFDITLDAIDEANQIATLVVRHVPPKRSLVKLPAAWMVERVGDTENNWVSVRRSAGNYIAAIGKETFDVQLKISLEDGVILSGTLDNVVDTRERDCTDAALRDCSETRSRQILRKVQISLDR